MANHKHRNALEAGRELHWYTIHNVLGQGGFGITYLAYDGNLKQNVAIKEYLPSGIAMRESDSSVHPITDEHRAGFDWGLERFLTEARTLTRFDHSNIVRVITVFELNQTAYMVMRYEQGKGLNELLPRNETLSERWLKKMIFPIIGGLSQVHSAGFIHRDIKPPNIFIREDNSPVLIDFGSARQALGQETRTLTALISPGYAPFEQYHAKSDKQGPWTDIYGLGATLYRGVTGQPPADALLRSEALLGDANDPYRPVRELAGSHYSAEFMDAIDHALAFREKDRPQTLKEWLQEINRKGSTTRPTTNIKPLTVPETQTPLTLMDDAVIEAEITTANPLKQSEKVPVRDSFRWFSKKTFALLLIAAVLFMALAIVKPWRALQRWQGMNAPANISASDEGLTGFNPSNTEQLTNQYKRALENNPDNSAARSALETLSDYHTAMAEQAVSNRNSWAARAHFRQALNAAPDLRSKQQIRRRIETLRK